MEVVTRSTWLKKVVGKSGHGMGDKDSRWPNLLYRELPLKMPNAL